MERNIDGNQGEENQSRRLLKDIRDIGKELCEEIEKVALDSEKGRNMSLFNQSTDFIVYYTF